MYNDYEYNIHDYNMPPQIRSNCLAISDFTSNAGRKIRRNSASVTAGTTSMAWGFVKQATASNPPAACAG